MSEFVEQTTPVGHLIVDADTRVSSFGFIDDDSDINEVGGMARWAQSSSIFANRIVFDRLYMSVRVSGAGRSQSALGVATGTNQVLIPSDTALESSHTSWRALRRRLRSKNRDSRRSPHQLAAVAQSTEGSETQLNAIRRLSAHVI